MNMMMMNSKYKNSLSLYSLLLFLLILICQQQQQIVQGYFTIIGVTPTLKTFFEQVQAPSICSVEIGVLVETDTINGPTYQLNDTSYNVIVVDTSKITYQNSRQLWIGKFMYPVGQFPSFNVNITIIGDSSTGSFNIPPFSCPDPADATYQATPIYYQSPVSASFELRITPSLYIIRYQCNPPNASFGYDCKALYPVVGGFYFVISMNTSESVADITSPFNFTITTDVGHSFSLPFTPTYKSGPLDLVQRGSSQCPPIHITLSYESGTVCPMGTIAAITSNSTQVSLLSTLSFSDYTTLLPVLGNIQDVLYFIDPTPSPSNFTKYIFAANETNIKNSSALYLSQYSVQPFSRAFPVFKASINFENIYSITFNVSHFLQPLKFEFKVGNSGGFPQNHYTIPAPFGYYVTPDVIEYTIPMNNQSKDMDVTIIQSQNEVKMTVPSSFPISDLIQPVIYDVSYKKIAPTSYIVKLQLSDLSGIKWIKFKSGLYGINSLANGDFTNGTFVFEYLEPNVGMDYLIYPNTMSVIDEANLEYSDSQLYDIYDSQIHIYPPNPLLYQYVTVDNFTHFEFVPNVVDTSNGPVNVSILFNLTTGPDGTFDKHNNLFITLALSPIELTSRWGLLNITAESYFHPIDQLFRIDFTVPQYTNNITSAYFSFVQNLVSTIQPSLIEKFGSNATLQIKSNNIDHLPPYFYSIEIPTVPVNGKAIFNFSVNDFYYGLDNGSIEIQSSITPIPYVFYFNDETRIAGDRKRGTYSFVIDIPSDCRNHILSIGKTELYDRGGWVSRYYGLDKSYFNPFYLTIGFLSVTSVLTCTQSLPDNTPPSIVSFNSSRLTMDVGSNDRDISFNLTIEDDAGGVGLDGSAPTVYLWGNQGEWLAVEASINNSPHFYYNTTVPHAFGVNGILVSVYGIRDVYQNLGGYSSEQLCQLSMPCYIATTYSLDIPSIYSVDKLYSYPRTIPVDSSLEIITIRGRGFGNDIQQLSATIQYPDSSQPQTQTITMAEYVVLFVQYNPRRVAPGKPVIVTITRSGKSGSISSMPIILPPPIYPPPFVPTPTPCSPSSSSSLNCTGNGVCTFDGCQCNKGWSGFYCESTVINVDEPTFNQTAPIVDIIVNNGTGNRSHTIIKSIISVVGVREITLDDVVFKSFKPKTWSLNITSPSDTNNNSIIMNYQTQLENISTIVNVTIEWFSKDSQVVFANQTINIPATSTKVSISLSSYPFDSFTNTLQVVMKTSIVAEYDSECSSKQFGGSLNDMEWMKLGIDDKTLWGQFIKRGIVNNNRIVSINNQILTDFTDDDEKNLSSDNTTFTTTYIGLNIPQYSQSIQLDPNFVHLITVDDNDADISESICKDDSKGLSMGQIAGIVVGCVVGGALIIGSSMYIIHRKRQLKSNRIMQQKLKRVSQQI